jgi:hypothetical protein
VAEASHVSVRHLSDQSVEFQFVSKSFADQLLDLLNGEAEEFSIP